MKSKGRKKMAEKKTSIGGQALIEGIMMKGPHNTAIAVRLPNGKIDVTDFKEINLKDKGAFFSLPIIRGVANLIVSLISGYKALMYSAEKSLEDEDTDEKGGEEETAGSKDAEKTVEPETAKPEENTPKDEKTEKSKPEKHGKADKKGEKKSASDILFSVLTVAASVIGVLLAIVLFMMIPSCIFNLINAAATPGIAVNWTHIWNGIDGGKLNLYRAFIEGLLKLAIFIGYIAVVTLQKDIKRVFQYHGAEHKTIFCYEKGLPLTVENCRRQIRFHPRCGTSFMFLMIIVGILISTVVVIFFPSVTKLTVLWAAIKILLVPLFCGVGYELIKYCGRHDNLFTKIVSAPGLWVQRLTTKEPDDGMLEVAIASVERVIPENEEDDKW